MDDARFKHLVAWVKVQLQAPAELFKVLDPDRQQGPFLRKRIDESRTSRVAWDSLCEIARDMLQEGRPLPAPLALFVAEVLDDCKSQRAARTRPRPPKRTDPKAAQHMMRLLIGHLTRNFDINPMRDNKGNRLPQCSAAGSSACDIVGAAAELNYKAAEAIWNGAASSYRMRKN